MRRSSWRSSSGRSESLFPGRIDLGLGRAPGTDHATAVALRRTLASNPDLFPQDVLELMAYFHPEENQRVQAVPGSGLDVPIYILGSSLFGAQVAAALGLPFAFASHFAAQQMLPAIDIYRERFKRSGELERPYVILGVNIVAADTDEEAKLLASSGKQAFTSLRAGMPIQLPPPSHEWARDVTSFDPRPDRDGAVDLVRRVAADDSSRPRRVRRADAAGRADRRLAHLRSRRPAALLRARHLAAVGSFSTLCISPIFGSVPVMKPFAIS